MPPDVRAKRWLIALALLTFACFSQYAQAQKLTFEGLQDFETVGDYYNGGTGSAGSGPGPQNGVTFSPNATALIRADIGGSGDFGGNPSGDTILFFLTDSAYTLNVSPGFAGALSFFYSSPFSTGTVTVYSGPDATGAALATLDLAATPDTGDGTHIYSPFVSAGLSFTGIARSIDFGPTANLFAYDDITFSAVPEPDSWALLGCCFISVLGIASRRYASCRAQHRRRSSPC